MQKQDLSKLQVRKVKALKRKLDTKPEEEKVKAVDEKQNGQKKVKLSKKED